MDYNQMVEKDNVDFGEMPPGPFLLGLLSAFENKFQAIADSFFEDITWKQFFAIICTNICKEAPTINELADVMESSHQNVKQILLKLEKKGFVEMVVDEKDRRKQRIRLTKKCEEFCRGNEEACAVQMNAMFEGISEEELMVTVQAITKMERNLKKL